MKMSYIEAVEQHNMSLVTTSGQTDTELVEASSVSVASQEAGTELAICNTPSFTLNHINGEDVYLLNIETPLSLYYCQGEESKVSDLLLLPKEEVNINIQVAKLIIADKEYEIYAARDSDDCNFYINRNGIRVKGYITASFYQIANLVDEFKAQALSLSKTKKTLFYSSPMVKLIHCVRDAKVQDYENFMKAYPNAFFKEDKNQILEQVCAKTYDAGLAGKAECNVMNLETFCGIYGYIITYNRVKNNVIIDSEVKEFSSQLEAQESFKHDLRKENIEVRNSQEQLLILAVLRYNVEQKEKATLHPSKLLGVGGTDNEFSTDEADATLDDTLIECLDFDSDEDEINFNETFEMMIMDVFRKMSNSSNYSLETKALASTQYFYNIIADDIADVEVLFNTVFQKALKEYSKVYSQKQFQKLLDGAKDDIMVCYTPVDNLKNQASLNDYISVPTFDAEITKTYTQNLAKFTVLIGGMEDGDLLPFKIKNLVNIKFASLDFQKLQNIDWGNYFHNLMLKHPKGMFLENPDVVKYQKRLQYDLLEDGVHDMLSTIIGEYEENHKEHQKTTCNAKFIIQKFGLTEIDTLSDHMKLSKRLRRIKILSEIRAKGFKISDSLFHISYEDLVTKYIF